MRVIGIVGLPGSGKSEAATVAAELDIPVLTMGDVIRAECRERGLDITEDNMGMVATDLREKGGLAAIADRSLPLIEAHLADSDVVLVDGIRGGAEVERFEEAFGDQFVLASIEVPFETRLARIRDRGRDPTAEASADLRERDERELGYGMGEAMERADVVIENTATLDAFHETIRRLLEGGLDAVDDHPNTKETNE
ncbi:MULTISPECIES: AAA family ATPase [unclassified Haladaptatus]|uniref:AAA family ATPase n=1 Tax=unclassified Haladaptatus TaxID=2622732 RepID=UPI0023E8F6DA|nr:MULTISPECIES: AAA family ATPase [unclassified Haladaptatus]